VLRTSPGANQQVAIGGTVTLFVSRGNQIQMPDVRNLTADDARKALKSKGFSGDIQFNTSSVSDPNLDGVVISQSTAPGQGVDPDGTVGLTVGKFNSSSGSSGSTSSSGSGRSRGN
jgi:beta-lactam-binding protein with PASTA domain